MTDDTIAVPEDGLADLRALLDVLDAEIAAGDADALLDPRGTFTLAQTLEHSAQSIGYAMTGYPKVNPVAVRGTVGRLVKHLFLGRGRMRHDLSAPVPGAPALDPSAQAEAAAARLRGSVERLASFDGELHPHPLYGRCSIPQAARLQAMHLREHLPGLAAHLAGTA